MPDTLYIRDEPALAALVERIAEAPEIALDTEFLRERTYYPQLCLIQIATRDVLALVDPLACHDLSRLWEVLLGDALVVLHAGSQDLEIIQRLAGSVPPRLFDTQIASAFLGYGDSVAYSRMVDHLLGSGPGRSEAYTDWTRRPLTPEQHEYALDDVRYLLQCADLIRAGLRERGRESWAEEEIRLLADATCHSPDPREQWRRVAGAKRLSGRALAVLQEAAAWREEEAVRRDVPRQRIVPDRILAEIGRRAPRSPEQVEKLRGLHPREAARSAKTIADLVARGLARPEHDWPAWPDLPKGSTDPGVEALSSLLDALVRSRGRTAELSPRLLGTRADLTLAARLEMEGTLEKRGPELLALFRGWRREMVGDDVIALMRGELNVSVERAKSGPRLVCERREPRPGSANDVEGPAR